ncbi:MAG: pyridoxamine 5'-phosphate oxidase family protein [Gammaproteobacteria bacterium]|nr:pyridoxamine 5'-phosphate oxidase family protein [Gammaproteobacteria bacterium]
MTKLNPSEFIKSHRYGVLSTHSVTEAGYPFGSITPYIISDKGEIAILISHLAEHTNNILANPKVALTLFDPEDSNNPQAGARITCLANARKAGDESDLRQRYVTHFADADMIVQLPGFHFYLLDLVKVRLIAGFGQVKWLEADQLKLD